MPERNPRTRSSRAGKIKLVGDLGTYGAVNFGYRYYTDTWDIKSHTVEVGYSRYFGEKWLADIFARYYTQTHANFYSDNAHDRDGVRLAQPPAEHVRRRRRSARRLSYDVRRVPGRYDVKVIGTYEYTRFKFKDFTDVRTGELYGYSANVFQLYLSATY